MNKLRNRLIGSRSMERSNNAIYGVLIRRNWGHKISFLFNQKRFVNSLGVIEGKVGKSVNNSTRVADYLDLF